MTRRRKVAEIRGARGNLVRNVHIQLHLRLVRNRREVEHGIGRAAERHIHGQRIHKCLLGHDVARADIIPVELHNLVAGVLREADALRVDRRNRSVAAKPHAEHLGETVQRVRGIHTGAAAAGRADLLLELGDIFYGHLAGRVSADRLKHAGERALLALHATRKHGAAAHKDGRDVDARRRHEETRHVLIAVRDADHRIKLMRSRETLGRIRNQVSCNQGVLHARVSHRNAVADRNGRHHDRHAARLCDAELHGIDNLVEVHVARDNFVVGRDDTDERLLHLLLGKAECIKQRAVGCLLHPRFHVIA